MATLYHNTCGQDRC